MSYNCHQPRDRSKKSPPLVTIVTPSFSQGRFLRRTIESVLRQTYPHIEYIVIDGGSTDHSRQILESYRNQFYWLSEPDGGQADAINKGFAKAQGSIRAYLNSDDVLLPTTVEKVVRYFYDHADWQLVYGRARYIDENDAVIGYYPTKPFSLQRLAEDSCICQPAAFWRAELAERIGPFDASLHFCMDYDYWLRAARRGEVIQHVDDVLACSRLYSETKTISGRLPMYQESIQVCKKHTGSVAKGPFFGVWKQRCDQAGWPWLRLCGAVSLMATVDWWLRQGKEIPKSTASGKR